MSATVPATVLTPPTPPKTVGVTHVHGRNYAHAKDSNNAGNMLPHIPRRVSSSSSSRPRFQVGKSLSSSSSSSSSSSDEDLPDNVAIGECIEFEDQDDTPRPSLEFSGVECTADCTTPTPAPVSGRKSAIEEVEVVSISNENTPVFPGIAARAKRGGSALPSTNSNKVAAPQDVDATSPSSPPLLSPSAAPIIPQSSAQISTIAFPSSSKNIDHAESHDYSPVTPTFNTAQNSTYESAIPFPSKTQPESLTSPTTSGSVASTSSSPPSTSSLASKRKISGSLKLNLGNMPNVLRMLRDNDRAEEHDHTDQVDVPQVLAPPAPVIRKKSGEVVKSSLKQRTASLPHGNRSRPSLEGLFPDGGLPPGSPSLSAPATPLAGPAMSFSRSMPSVSQHTRSGSTSLYSSTATTPVKNVHFDSKLEHVKLFLSGQKPAAVSRDGSPDEFTTGDSASDGEGWGYFRSKRPGSSGSDSEEAVKRGLEMKLLNMECLSNGENRNLRPPFDVRLATLGLSADKTAIEGSVVVKNLAFEKWVAVRFTFDSWMTTSEVAAKWERAWIPPPTFYRASPHSPASVFGTVTEKERQENFDLFSFRIRLTDLIPRIANKTLVLAIRYSIHGKEMWDNNGGGDYRASFEVRQPAATSANVKGSGEKEKEKSGGGGITTRLRKELERVARESGSDPESPSYSPLPTFLNNNESGGGRHSLSSRYDLGEALKSKNQWKPSELLFGGGVGSPRFGAHSRTNTYPGAPWSNSSRQNSPTVTQQSTPPYRQQSQYQQYEEHRIPASSFVALARSRGSPREANGDTDDDHHHQNSIAFFSGPSMDTGIRRSSLVSESSSSSSSRHHQRSYFDLRPGENSSPRDGLALSQVKRTGTTGAVKPLIASPDSDEKGAFRGLGIGLDLSASDSSSTIFTPSPSTTSASGGGFLIRAMSDSDVISSSATPSPRSATPIPDITRTSSSPSPSRSQSFPPSSPNVVSSSSSSSSGSVLAPAPVIPESASSTSSSNSSSFLSAHSSLSSSKMQMQTQGYPRHPWSNVLRGNGSEDNSTPSTASSMLSPSLSSALSSSIPSPLSPSDGDFESMMRMGGDGGDGYGSVPYSAPVEGSAGAGGSSSVEGSSGSNGYSYLLDRFCFYTGAFDNIYTPSSPGGIRRSNSSSTIEDYLSTASSPARDNTINHHHTISSPYSGNTKLIHAGGSGGGSRTRTTPPMMISPSMSEVSLSGYGTPTSPGSSLGMIRTHSSPLPNAIHV